MIELVEGDPARPAHAEALAPRPGFCKLTLEALAANAIARAARRSFGFGNDQLDHRTGVCLRNRHCPRQFMRKWCRIIMQVPDALND